MNKFQADRSMQELRMSWREALAASSALHGLMGEIESPRLYAAFAAADEKEKACWGLLETVHEIRALDINEPA